MSTACAVALIDRRELPSLDCASLLSRREQAETATFRNPERRARTLTSRMLSKYLISRKDAPGFQRLAARELVGVEGARWSLIELLSGPAGDRGPTQVFRAGVAMSGVAVSSSHCGVYTASAISRERIGVDLERIERRRPEFYTGSFSPEERSWVERVCASNPDWREAAFTLLWSVKEAFLKAAARRDFSIWLFPSWTVRFDGGVEGIFQANPVEQFTRVHGDLEARGFSATFEIGAMRIHDMVLTTVQYQEPAR